MIFLSFLLLKFLFKELTYKFLVDYFAKNRILKIKNFKFIDLFLNNINSKGFTFFNFLGLFKNNYLKSLNFNSIVVVIFIIFLIFWGFILIKNICFAYIRFKLYFND